MANNEYTAIAKKIMEHIGNKNSGRYPRGSGDRPYQHTGGSRRQTLKEKRISEYAEKKEKEAATNPFSKRRQNEVSAILEKRKKEAPIIKREAEAMADTSDRLKFILANKQYFSSNEINDAVRRHTAELSLKNSIIQSAPPSKFTSKLIELDQKTGRTISSILNIVTRGSAAYNAAADMYNMANSNSINAGNLNAWSKIYLNKTTWGLKDKKK